MTFTPVYVARLAASAEQGILAAYGWVPYLGDIEDDDARGHLSGALEKIEDALAAVRQAREEAERAIVTEAVAK